MNHVHARPGLVVDAESVQLIGDRVVRLVHEVVGAAERGARAGAVGAIPELALGLGVARGQHRVDDDALPIAGGELVGQARSRVEIDVDALVDVLVAAGQHEHQGVLTIVSVVGGQLGELEQLFAGALPLLGRHRARAEAVRKDDVGFAAEEMLAFERGDLADCREDVRLSRGDRLHRMLRRDVELFGGGLGVDSGERLIEIGVCAAAGERATEHGRVRREHGSDFGRRGLQMKDGACGHPLVCLDDGALTRGQKKAIPNVLDDLARAMREQDRVVVVPGAEE